MADWRYSDQRFSERYGDRGPPAQGRPGMGPGQVPGSGPGPVDDNPSKRRRDYEYGGPVGARMGEREGLGLAPGGLPLGGYAAYNGGRDRGAGDRMPPPAAYDDRLPAAASWRDSDPGLRQRDMPPSSMGVAPYNGGPMMMSADDVMLRGRGAPLDLGPPGRGTAGVSMPPLGEVAPALDPPLPADASPTLYIDNLPEDCTRREASHIFRPFIGFKEVRLVHKEGRRGGPSAEKMVLCFVDFADSRCAATALEALQGYRFDESDFSSPNLRIDFARQGPRHSFGSGRDEFRRGDYDRDRGRGEGGGSYGRRR